MAKALVIDHEKCDGCRKCVSACAIKHTGTDDPVRSRIRIEGWMQEGVYMPVVCHQCEDAPCIAACPTLSRGRDVETGKTTVNYDRCISCKTCIAVCPFGASRYDRIGKQVITCDLCDGDPQCIKVCDRGAISYVEKGDIGGYNRTQTAMKLGKPNRYREQPTTVRTETPQESNPIYDTVQKDAAPAQIRPRVRRP